MSLNFLDNTNIIGSLSAISNISTQGKFVSGGQDVYAIINTATVYRAGSGISTIQTANNTNNAVGAYSNISGGCCNTITVSGSNSFIGNGFCNTANGSFTNIIGGQCNVTNTSFSTIIGGQNNTTQSGSNFIGIGSNNTASGYYSSILSGKTNTASGRYSFIANGYNNTDNGNANTFILGTGLSASRTNYTYVNNISSTCVTSTSALWIGNVAGTPTNGTITNKFPIYNSSGVLLGYIPIYTS
jgi:hypothetical protein